MISVVRGLYSRLGLLWSAAHIRLYRWSGGRLGATFRGCRVLLLTTTGRRTGSSRTTPVFFVEDGDRFALAGSNGGNARHPGWVLNLRGNPWAKVELEGSTLTVRAREASGGERARLWSMLAAMYPSYDAYQRRTERQIPVIVLERADGEG